MRDLQSFSLRLMAGAALCGVVAGLGAPAMAADQAPAAGTAAGADGTIGEIVVVARKRAETLIDAPLAITALSAATLEQHGITDIYALSAFTPGLKVENEVVNRNDRTFHTYTIRGIYPSSDSPERQTVTVFMDGVPVDGDIEGLDNVQQVEVVNGPQSAYFGRSTFAGAINLITRAPSFTPQATFGGSYGSFGTYEGKMSLEGGIIPDKLSTRLSIRDYHTDGDYNNAAQPGQKLGERDTKSVSIAGNYTPTEKLTIRAFGEAWIDEDGPHASAQLQPADFNCKTPTGQAYYCGALKSVPSQDIGQQTNVPQSVLDAVTGRTGKVSTVFTPQISHFGLERHAYEGHISADYKLPYGFTLDANAAYDSDNYEFITDTGFRSGLNNVNPNYGTAAGTAAGVLPYYSRTVLGQNGVNDASTEIRLSSPVDQPLKGMLGFNYFHLNSEAVTNAFGNTGVSVPTNLNINTANTYGIFGSASYDFGHGFSLSAEGRYQIERIGSAVLRSLSVPAGGVDATGLFRSFTPRVILDYKPVKDITLYVSYSEGTRPGAFNTLFYSLSAAAQAAIRQQVSPALAIPEEHLNMEEIGVKGEFLNRTVTLLADVYTGQWRNRQIPQQVAYLIGTTFFTTQITVADGAVDLKGVEFQGTWRATHELTFNGTVDYSGTALKNSFDTGALQQLGVNFVPNNSLPRYPLVTASASMNYERPATGDYMGFFHADYIFTGRQYDSETNLAWTPDSSKVNLSLGLHNEKYRWELFATNIFNDRTPVTVSRGNDTYTQANVITTAPPEPAAVGVRGTAKF